MMRLIMKTIQSIMCSLPLILLYVPLTFALEREFELDGVVYEESRPDEAVAVLNGEMVVVGTHMKGYEVVSIFPGVVRLKQLDGEHELTVSVADKMSAAEKRRRAHLERLAENEAALKAHKQRRAQKTGLIQTMADSVRNVRYGQVVIDLRKVFLAAVMYQEANNQERERNLTVDELILADYLSPAFADGIKGAYRYSMEVTAQGIQVAADPLKADKSAMYFLMDEDGQIYVQPEGPATRESPLYGAN